MIRKPPKGKSLAEVKPELAKEWHPTKNGDLTPFDVYSSSGKKVWWKCEKGDDHEWFMTPNDRTSKRKRGCSICSGKKVVLSNSLAITHPDIAKEWHPMKNGEMTPYDITIGSHKKVWWKCEKGIDHEWEAPSYNRLRANCPICSGQKTVESNTLLFKYPEIASKWHPTKNGKLKPSEIYYSSMKKIWWKCDKGDDHVFNSTVRNFVISGPSYCPICTGRKAVFSNCLATLFPDIANQWNSTMNGELTPFGVVPFSNKKVWWKCDKGIDHIWKTTIAHRQNRGCPYCSNQKVSITNCLATTYPDIAKEWHPSMNGGLTPFIVLPGTEKKVWWKCKKGDDHIWKAYINIRTRGTSCPYCTLTPQSRQELTITFELKQFFDIDPKGFKIRINGKVLSIDIFLQELNLGIEFDGSYWHKGKRELDKLKTERLEDDGFKIMRIREEPLKVITEIDIISKTPFNAKEVTNNILMHIIEAYSLDAKRNQKIEEYLLKKEIQNEKGLDTYIDKILTEKAVKK